MVRFLQVLLALVAARILWKLWRGRAQHQQQVRPGAGGGAEARGRVIGCARCDLHIPEERAVVRDGRSFCSDACAAAENEA